MYEQKNLACLIFMSVVVYFPAMASCVALTEGNFFFFGMKRCCVAVAEMPGHALVPCKVLPANAD